MSPTCAWRYPDARQSPFITAHITRRTVTALTVPTARLLKPLLQKTGLKDLLASASSMHVSSVSQGGDRPSCTSREVCRQTSEVASDILYRFHMLY